MPDPGGVIPAGAAWRPVSVGSRARGGSWRVGDFDDAAGVTVAALPQGGATISFAAPGAAAVELAFAAPADMQAFGGGERFDTLDLRGRSVRYYLENFGLCDGTYLPSPWLATTLGFSLALADEAPATLHIGAPFDPDRLRVQVEGERMTLHVHTGDLSAQYARLIERVGPPAMPHDHFFGLWKAGDWRVEDARTVAADLAGHAALDLPLAVKLIDAYWSSEVHSFAFDPEKYPDAAAMIAGLSAQGTRVYLWLCPWVVVGTRSHETAARMGYLVADAEGRPIIRRPGANPNTRAALIDYANPAAAAWWADSLRRVLDMGVTGFKADFGEQLPEHAVLHSGETGGRAHNAFVRHYLAATIAAFDGRTPAIISRSGSPAIRAPIWTGDQTSDFCPKTGLPAAIRAVQSAALSGWSFVGSDLGGYFGTPTPQVFARWAEFAAFTPLMMLHGLGCREPWDMPEPCAAIWRRYARLHLALGPVFRRFGRIAAAGGPPLIRMMPYAFPEVDWRGVNDWDQQFMLGDDILVAPVAFYGDARAVQLPAGRWYDVLARRWIAGPQICLHDVPLAEVPIFVRAGAVLTLAIGGAEIALRFMADESPTLSAPLTPDARAEAEIWFGPCAGPED